MNPKLKKPPWLKRRLPHRSTYEKVRQVLKRSHLHTVCQEAMCPNLWECFSQETALGTVAQGPDGPPDPDEPARVAEAVLNMKLGYVVVTSVTRDDLTDGGAGHFVQTIQEIHKRTPIPALRSCSPTFWAIRPPSTRYWMPIRISSIIIWRQFDDSIQRSDRRLAMNDRYS